MLEYLKNVPQYAPELYQLYKYSRVVAVTYHFEVVNLSQRPFEMMGTVMPYDESTSSSVAQASEKPGVVRRLISGAGGIDKAVMTQTCTAQSWFGNPFYTKDYWVDENQANNSTPLDQYAPAYLFLATPVLPGSSMSFVCTSRI